MTKLSNLSVVISAFNEEKNIADCLKSVGFVSEIIVIDNSSTDDTVKIAQKYTNHIFKRPNNPMLNINKNYGFSKATNEWILNLDADERVSETLAEEIQQILQSPHADGYLIPRKNIIFGKWIQHGLWWPDYQLRLFKKKKGKFKEEHVHELITLEGDTEKLTEPMVHENYQTISQYLRKLDQIYTENEVENLLKKGMSVSITDAIRFPLGDFLKTFFLQEGYKDGMHGLALSMLQAVYAEVVFLKLWERKGFQDDQDAAFLGKILREFKRAGYEFSYWITTLLIQQTKNPLEKTLYRFRRKKMQQKLQ